MHVVNLGNSVFILQFLPDGRRLIVGTATAGEVRAVSFEVLSLLDGTRVRLDVPGAKLDDWWYAAWYGNAVAVHPSGESCDIAWAGRLYSFRTADGVPLPVPGGATANQVVRSPEGGRLLLFDRLRGGGGSLTAIAPGPHGGTVAWQFPAVPGCQTLAGFLPDGNRFVTVEEVVRIRSAATGEPLAAGRHKPVGSQLPQLSADGRLLGAVGYHSMYFWDLATLDKPRRISASSSFGDFRSFAFHPGNNTVAVIHGGPTLVKVYDLGTLKQVHKWTWKLGPLRSVAYSPDGTLGAAGSEDGRVVVWDVDG